MALLNHPNVVQIIDKDREDDLLYFVMEYVPGTSLDAIMSQRRLSLPEVFRVVKGICRGLEAAHRQNIVHRDLNPRNVLVSEDLTVVKLADFGISRVEDISRQQGTLSTSEVSLGSLHYMSPEQATNMVEADHRTDIYSLGVTLYEMLTGRVPVGRFNLPSQINTEVPSDVDPLVLRCLEVDPAEPLPDRQPGARSTSTGWKTGSSWAWSTSSRASRNRRRRSSSSRPARSASASARRSSPSRRWWCSARAATAYFLLRPARRRRRRPSRRRIGRSSPSRFPSARGRSRGETLADRLAEVEPPPEEPLAAPTTEAEIAPRTQATAEQAQTQEDLDVARDKLAAGLHGPALEDLERFVEEHAASALVPEAYLLKAQAQLAQGETELALATYVEIGSRFADSPQAPAAAFERARLAARDGGKESAQEARQLYAAVAADYPRSKWAPAALAAQAQIENELKLTVTDPDLNGRAPASRAAQPEAGRAVSPLRRGGVGVLAAGRDLRRSQEFRARRPEFCRAGPAVPRDRL